MDISFQEDDNRDGGIFWRFTSDYLKFKPISHFSVSYEKLRKTRKYQKR